MHVRNVIWTGAMTSRSLQNLRSHRSIGSLVANHIGFHRCEAPLRIAAHGIGHFYGVTLRMKSKAFFATQRELYRAARHLRKKRCLSLNAHVFFAAECAAV